MNTAQLQAMDKITGKVSIVEAPVNSEVTFGSFSIVVRSCKTRSPEEAPENFAFVDVVDNYKSENPVNIFRGWMMSSSPALNAVAHPIYDVWLLKCVNSNVKAKKLSDAELKARNEIAKKPVDEEAPVAPAKEKESEKDLETKTAIENPAEAVENEAAAEAKAIEESKKTAEAKPVEAVLPVSEPVIDDGAPKSLLNVPADAKAAPAADTVHEEVQYKPKAVEAEVPGEFLVIKKDNLTADVTTEPASDESKDSEDAVVEPEEKKNREITPEEAAMLPELLNNAEPISNDELNHEIDEENGMADEIPLVTSDEIEENGMVEDQLINISPEDSQDLDLKADALKQ